MKKVQVENSSEKDEGNSFIGAVIGLLIWMILVGVWYFNYSFPSGEATLSSFMIMFLRELIALGVGLIAVGVVASNKMRGTRK